MRHTTPFFRLALVLLLAAGLRAGAATSVGELRCENLDNPQGIDSPRPRLSWMLQASGRDVAQSAYEILVASSEKKLAQNQGDLWDSGKVVSDTSILTPYAGRPLVSRELCFWKVRVWDNHGSPSPWSKPAAWSMGILNADEWGAQWIGLDGGTPTNYLTGASWIWTSNSNTRAKFFCFRRVVTLPAGRGIKRAAFEFTAVGACQGWMNQLNLNGRDNFKIARWNDLTTRMEPGNSYAFGIDVSSAGADSPPPGVIGKLTIEFTDGEVMTVPTDEKWRVSDIPDSRWNTPAFDDSTWVTAKVLGPAGMAPYGPTTGAESRVQPARYLRKEFPVQRAVARATVSFCGLGLSELYMNGKKIGDAVLSPAFSQYNRRQFYVTYDVTENLKRGANAMGVILGNGRYYADRSKTAGGTVTFGWPKLLLNLRIEYTDGSVAGVVSDDSWKLTTNGPIRANNDFDGEEYDARKELGDWSQPGYDGTGWSAPQVVTAPGGELSAQMMNPIRVTGTRKPVSVREIKPGDYIYDLGQNMVGWCRLRVRGPAGRVITLRHAETLGPDGLLYLDNLRGAEVTDQYTCKGGGLETWEPRFVTHGFRYVEMRGYPGRPDLNAIEGCVVNDDLPVAGYFRCSNELINRIYTNIVWGTRGNYRSVPTDCPQRDERQGWLGDRSEECLGEAYLFDIEPLYAKWRQDMADAQRTNGSIPDVAPAYWQIYSDDVTWPSSAIIIPGALKRQYGDGGSLAQNYDSAARWMDHMLAYASDNLISRDSYGDWCVPPEDPAIIHSRDPARQTDRRLLATAYFYHDLGLMEEYARALGREADARRWHTLGEAFKAAFNNKFLDRDNGRYANGSQTSCVLPLAFGLVPDDVKQKIFAHLVDKIENESHGHVGTGLIGGQYLNRVLSDNGRPDLCYTIASQTNYPGWGYMVQNGATTIWELWNGNTADPSMNSGNHVMLIGDLVTWFYEYLAGIAPDNEQPGFKHIIMKPQPVAALDWVKATHQSPYGLISSEWHRAGNKFDWRIEIPPNTTATVWVPATGLDAVKADGARPTRYEDGRAEYVVGSGKYHFISPLALASSSPKDGAKGAAAAPADPAPTANPIVKSEFIYDQAPFPSCHASTMAETKSGLVAAWFGGTAERNPDVCIYVSRMQDGHWTPPVAVADGVGFATNRLPTWNPVLFQPKSGPLLLFYKVGPKPAAWWGMMMSSQDDGKTWSKPVRLPEGILGPIKNKPVQLANGDILCGSSTEGDGWKVHFERSSDLGKTWTATPPVNDGKTIGAIQPSILTLPDGKLESIGRTRNDKMFQILSSDGGQTWGDMSLTDLPNPDSGTDAVTLRDGRQLLVYNHNIRTGSNNKGRSPLNVAVSPDGARWFAALVLENDPDAPSGFAYPAVIQTSDGLVHITYTWERRRIKHVVIDPARLQLRPIVNGQWPE